MNYTVLTKTYKDLPFAKNEILRYAGVSQADGELYGYVERAISELKDTLSYKVCYSTLPVKVSGSLCDFGYFHFTSRSLAKNLQGCDRVLLFAATVGASLDRQIAKALLVSPAKALILDAVGSAQAEVLCDRFCSDFEKENGVAMVPRFSAGYGDLDIGCQKVIFSHLGCSKQIGLSLLDSMLMSPSKSVTAFAGIKQDGEKL